MKTRGAFRLCRRPADSTIQIRGFDAIGSVRSARDDVGEQLNAVAGGNHRSHFCFADFAAACKGFAGMGQMRFAIAEPQRICEEAVQCAYMSGIEGVPFRSVVAREGRQLIIQRDVNDSGNLYLPWDVPERGRWTLSTASLMERAEPYHLEVELARGVLNRARNQFAGWQAAGIVFPQSLNDKLQAATRHFFSAATSRHDVLTAAREAEQAIILSLDAVEELVSQCSKHVLELRQQQTPQLPTLMAGPVDQEIGDDWEPSFLAAFNTGNVPFCWRTMQPGADDLSWESADQRIAWCKERDLKIIGGPLFQASRSFLPDWVRLWEDDFDRLQACVVQHVAATVQRYHEHVDVWHCVAAMNVRGVLALTDEQSLRLTLAVIETVRNAAPKTPLFISLDQPWAEYMAREDTYLSPIHFADALVRADVGLAGVGLEINLGYCPGGTLPRDPLDFGQQVDRWTQLGLPLVVQLCVPSDDAVDPAAERQSMARPTTLPAHAALVENYVTALLAKPAVHCVAWRQLSDSAPHEYAHGGLFDASGNAKPVLQTMASLRKCYLT